MKPLHPSLSKLRVVYSEDMVSDAGDQRSPGDRKPKAVAEALLATRWPIELVRPTPAPIAALYRIHDQDFVDDVLHLRRRNGFGSASESVSRSLVYTCGACYRSALLALQDGISASLTSGFHHAGPRVSRGFCTFNGLMSSAVQLLDEGRLDRVAIIDCDYHYGDGTQAIIDELKLADRVLHVSFGAKFRKPEQAESYLQAVSALEATLAQYQPQLILYQAGADVHVDDPLGGVLTSSQMKKRDARMISIARALDIPIAWNLAGGYQVEADGSIPRVVQLHLDTFEQALRVWGLL